jgi:hypothetical protein
LQADYWVQELYSKMADENTNLDTPNPSTVSDPSSPASWNAGLAGMLQNMPMQTFTPQQQQQRNDLSMQLMQHAANQAMHQDSPLHKIGNVLRGLGTAAAGIAPNAAGVSSNMPGIASEMARNAYYNNEAREKDIVGQLKAAQELSRTGFDPKMVSQILGAYGKGGQVANTMVHNANQKQRYDQLNQISQGRLTQTTRANDIKQQMADITKDWHANQAKMGFDKNNMMSQHYGDIANHLNRIDSLEERIKPYEAAIKQGTLDLNRDATYQKLNQAYQKEYTDTGMKLMALHANLQQRAQHVQVDKRGVAHYTVQDADANGQPTGEPYEVALPTMQQATSELTAPKDFENMSDDEVANSILSAQQPNQTPAQAAPAQAPAAQPMPQPAVVPTTTAQAQQMPVPGNAQAPPSGPIAIPPLNRQQASGAAGLVSSAAPKRQITNVKKQPQGTTASAGGIRDRARKLYDHQLKSGMSDTEAAAAVKKAFPELANR